MKRVLPISSLRFVLAMWVVLGHFFPPILHDKQHSLPLVAARAFLNNSVNGQAAVIVFFIISGFCIHFPNRKGLAIRSWKMYFTRRYVRILIPMTVAIALSVPLGMKFGLFSDSILWSLLCEEIYYLLYPGLLTLRDSFGWRNLLIAAWSLSLLVILTHPGARYFLSFGPALTWALFLPCWLLGCRLAERLDSLSALPVSAPQIWMWRVGIWAISVAASAVSFHTPIGFPWTLNLFALPAVCWVEREIRFYRAGRDPKFESLGEASYSIYLTHVHGMAFLYLLPLSNILGPWSLWFGGMFFCGSFATLFYWLVERPSHQLARRLSRPAGSIGSEQPLAADVAKAKRAGM
jgi:peptidoglycan/LPS O-acetylase OafA/YrhL